VKKLQMLVLLIALFGSVVVFPGETADAANRCGSWQAGEHTTRSWSGRSYLVTGDNNANNNQTSWIAPGRTANSRGICDADFTLEQHPGGDVWYKISFGHLFCNQRDLQSPSYCGWRSW